MFGINYLMGSNLVLLLQFLLAINWAYTEINVGGGAKYAQSPTFSFSPPPLRASREGGPKFER